MFKLFLPKITIKDLGQLITVGSVRRNHHFEITHSTCIEYNNTYKHIMHSFRIYDIPCFSIK